MAFDIQCIGQTAASILGINMRLAHGYKLCQKAHRSVRLRFVTTGSLTSESTPTCQTGGI